MSSSPDQAEKELIQQYDAEQRFSYFIKSSAETLRIWILTDEYGSVMLNTDDEDCVPVWPDQSYAEAWATGEWEGCTAEPISLNKWHSRWTHGLEDDGFAVVVFPIEDQEGLVVYPEDLDKALKKAVRKRSNT